jgi:TonB family protein
MTILRIVAGAIVALGIAMEAGAQPAPTSPTGAASPASELPGASKRPGVCGPFYPSLPALAGVQGTTLLLVRIRADGGMKDPAIIQSSRDPDLDEAALACINNAPRGVPPMQDGKPIEVSWVVRVVWQLHGPSDWQPAPAAGAANSCAGSYPPPVMRKHVDGTARISYRIAADGAVKNPVVTESSGSPDLDQASLDCVSAFRYWPATHDGKPVELDRTVDVDWNLERR